MIWLLLNGWWLVVAVVGLLAAAVALNPAVLPVLRRLPSWAYAAAGAVLAVSLASSWLVGVGEERCRAAQEAAEKRADAKGERVAKASQAAAQKARDSIRKESSDAQVQIREIVRTLPATCPPMPDELRDVLQRQVEAARAELQRSAADRD